MRATRRPTAVKRLTKASSRLPSPPVLVHRFQMPSLRDAVAPAVARVLRATRAAHLDDDQRADLAVAVSEALSNAAIHGNHLRPGSHVRVTVKVKPDARAIVEIADSGAGFDASAISDPTDPEHLLDTGGRGLFLMRRLVTRLQHNARGNQVRLVIERRARRRTDCRLVD
jgi:serine/threonine-protein kinase RsbW